MRAPGTLIAAVSCVVLAGGCRKSAAPEPAASAPPAVETTASTVAAAPGASAPSAGGPPAAPASLPQSLPMIEVRVGLSGTAESGIGGGQSTFNPGQDVLAGVDVSLLPAGAVVKASWVDGNGGGRGEEQKTVGAGTKWLIFTAPGSYNWGEGTYRVDVTASTGGIASASFRIVPPSAEQADQPG